MARRRIEGCRAIVTGASSGIGAAIAIALARGGADSILLARREQSLQQLSERISRLGRKAHVLAGDVTDSATRRAALELARETWGGLDLLINNAGISAHGRFATASPDRLRRIMEVNFFAAAEFIREAVPLLEQGRQPMVVNIGSIIGHRGIPRNSEYCASKFALHGLSEAIRPELAQLGIDLLVVSPGPTETELFDNLLEKDDELAWTDRRGKPADAVAQETVQAIRRGRSEIIPSWRGRGLVWLNRLAPRLVDRIMKRHG
jgi:short-subunit dehydrogenase